MKTLDILVKAIDNYGDIWFALDIAESLLQQDTTLQIRFFSDDVALFTMLCANTPHPRMVYQALETYTNPSDTVILCFDMKIDMDVFLEAGKPIQILILSYLRFDDGVPSMNGVSYEIDKIRITHLVPSPRKDSAGIVLHENSFPTSGNIEQDRAAFFQAIQRSIPPELHHKKWLSVFSYPPTLAAIEAYAKLPEASEWVFILFEKRDTDSVESLPNGAVIWRIPYLRFNILEAFFRLTDANIVRGENTAMMALSAKKPFLWDIYKESNGAHLGKLDEFFDLFEKTTEVERLRKLHHFHATDPNIETIWNFLTNSVILNYTPKNIVETIWNLIQ